LKQAITTVVAGKARSNRRGGGRSISSEAIRFAFRYPGKIAIPKITATASGVVIDSPSVSIQGSDSQKENPAQASAMAMTRVSFHGRRR
jgi:hypothetical protein